MNKNNKAFKFINNHSSDILTGLSISGLITTAILVAKESPKVKKILEEEDKNKLDLARETLPIIIPSLITGSMTILCMLSANVLNKRKQASLASAYALINTYYNDYKGKLKEIYGEEAHDKIVKSIAVEKAKNVPIYTQGMISSTNLDFDEPDSNFDDCSDEKRLFYDAFSKRYFESTVSKVLQAEYHLNRNFCLSGCVPANEFYEFLGLELLECGDKIGWSCDEGLYWIDFNHDKTILEDGLEVYTIEMEWLPYSEFEDD